MGQQVKGPVQTQTQTQTQTWPFIKLASWTSLFITV